MAAGSLSISDSVFRRNASFLGGAIYVAGGADVAISQSAFIGNFAHAGGAIYVTGANSALTVSNSTFYQNESINLGSVNPNTAAVRVKGDGTTGDQPTATFTHVTFVDNLADTTTHTRWHTSQIQAEDGATLNLYNSIVAGGGDVDDCSVDSDSTFNGAGNLIEDDSCSPAVSGAPHFGALAGSPAYLPLSGSSPAIGAADSSHCLTDDQRGETRPNPASTTCDIGAYESGLSSPSDAIVVDSGCTLANAINSANNDRNTSDEFGDCEIGSGADMILITSDATTSGVITLGAALPAVTTEISIDGDGFTVSGDDSYQILQLTSDDSNLTIENLTLTKGKVTGDNVNGGAIQMDKGELTILNSVISDSESGADGGAIFVTAGNVAIENSVINDNSAAGGGGIAINGCDDSFSITRSTFSNNAATGSATFGGAIWAGSCDLSVSNSTFYDNTAGSLGGAIYFTGGTTGSSTITLTHNTFNNNSGDSGNNGEQLLLWRGVFNLYNNIVAGDTDGNACRAAAETDIAELRGNSKNLVQDGSCSADLSGDPKLAGLTSFSDQPNYYPLASGSPAIDAGDATYCGADTDAETDQPGRTRPQGSGCDIGAYETLASELETEEVIIIDDDSGEPDPRAPGEPTVDEPDTGGRQRGRDSSPRERAPGSEDDDSERGEDDSDDDSEPPAGATATPAASTCESLPANFQVTVSHPSTQCQQVGNAGIGNQEIINAGFIDAVDVWSYLREGVEVCIQRSGPMVLLDAATMPREIKPLATYSKADMTCVWLLREGTVVLLQEALSSTYVAPPATPAAAELDCMVTTTAPLNFRASPPDGDVILVLAANVTLTALERTNGWFRVDFYGRHGWISAHYVIPRGDCD